MSSFKHPRILPTHVLLSGTNLEFINWLHKQGISKQSHSITFLLLGKMLNNILAIFSMNQKYKVILINYRTLQYTANKHWKNLNLF